eukprot:CAMPEP_0118950308 /NCGR_PEP_ID=MMETSP1169-20130426/51136_1 /TAXON_ID=36882 /ORGANISM="Pyramimonas obovata, Strain CCMP722" /LENGTH=544 /DNA_ID=CAMNT_0006897119 /DNA_START=12 /DNA_END=1643 /DNA_ORIENTATION=+
MDTFTQHFVLCYSEAKGISRGLSEQLEEYYGHLKRHVERIPSCMESLLPIVLSNTGKRRPFTPAWVTGLPLKISGISRVDAENLTCLLVRSYEEAQLGLTALLLGNGDTASVACTFSLFADGFQQYILHTDNEDEEGTEQAAMDAQEKQLLLLGPLLSVRKAASGMLTPAEYKIFSYSIVSHVVREKGLHKFVEMMEFVVPHKAKEKEDNLFHTLDSAIANATKASLHSLEEEWKTALFAKHKEALAQTQNQAFALLPDELKQVDNFASTAVSAPSYHASTATTILGGKAKRVGLAAATEQAHKAQHDEGVLAVYPAAFPPEAEPEEEAEAEPSDPAVPAAQHHIFIPLRKLTPGAAVVWTIGWVRENENALMRRALACVVYLFVFAVLYPLLLLLLFDDAVKDEDWALFGGVAAGIALGLAGQAQAQYLLKASTPSGARFIPVLQLKLAKHMVEFPQPHLDMCTATDLRRYLSILDNDVPAVNKNIDALFVGLSSSLQTLGALAALFVISPIQGAIVLLVLPLFYLYSEKLAYSMSTTAVFVR